MTCEYRVRGQRYVICAAVFAICDGTGCDNAETLVQHIDDDGCFVAFDYLRTDLLRGGATGYGLEWLYTRWEDTIEVACPAITPTVGANLLLNAGFETPGSGGADVFANWNENTSGTSTVNDEGADVHSGSHACRFDVDAANSLVQVLQTVLTVGQWYQMSAWMKSDSGTPAAGFGSVGAYAKFNMSQVYTQYTATILAANVQATFLRSTGCNSKKIYIDDVAANLVTNTDLLLTARSRSAGRYTVSPSVADGTQTGMKFSFADANNYVMAVVDLSGSGGNAIRAHTMIGGVLTKNVINGVIGAYEDAKRLSAILDDSDNLSIYYSGLQIGATTPIATGTLGTDIYGFNTYAGNDVGTLQVDGPRVYAPSAIVSVVDFNAVLAQPEDFSIVYIPDPHMDDAARAGYFLDQMTWCAAQAAALSILAVVNIGDLTTGPTEPGWTRIQPGLNVIQAANIPNCIAPGNHDYEGSLPYSRDLTTFLAHMPTTYYTNKSWWNGGFYDNNTANLWFTIEHEGQKFIIVSLEYDPRTAVLSWIDGILAAHPGYTPILGTHYYLDQTGTVANEGEWARDVVAKYGARLAGCGHLAMVPYASSRVDLAYTGNRFMQFWFNYQALMGLGYLRIVKFKPGVRAALHQTYSPTSSTYLVTPEMEFVQTW